MNETTLIFPMAGKGQRFGYTFKPFLEVNGHGKFIELAFEPFKRWLPYVKKVVFVFLKEQEEKYNVSTRLSEILEGIEFETCILEEETSGPAETVRMAVKEKNIKGGVLLCDCDHALHVDNIFGEISDGADVVIPVWPLRGENIKSWSVASVTDNGHVTGIAEKELPSTHGEFCGVIGCYYIKNIEFLSLFECQNISELIAAKIAAGGNVKAVKVEWAKFFGDPDRLERTFAEESKGTIFCDLDGTVIVHEDSPEDSHGIKVLDGAVKRIRDWKDEGYYIVLSTARNGINREYLVNELIRNNIVYDELIMDLSSGPRIVVNDRKPSEFLRPSASAFEVKRNQGIMDLDVSIPKVNIIERMKGGSFADTLLVEKDGKQYVRKTTPKTENLELGYIKLKKQAQELVRFKNFYNSLVPTVMQEEDNSYEYYYEMEYLDNYTLLSACDIKTQYRIVEKLLKLLTKNVYNYNATLKDGRDWLKQHLEAKVYKRGELLDHSGRLRLLLDEVFNSFGWIIAPKKLCPIHGDLTFENILVDMANDDFKIIDMDGAEYIDAMELDMGKMFQSIITEYETWSKLSDDDLGSFSFELQSPKISGYIRLWSRILDESEEIIKSKMYFYTALHLIRMIPFRLKASPEQGRFAYNSALRLLNEIGKVLQ
tara:strand:- start:868 stop:2832 length:1965 start_codon:yes stop_codon:yes gene_type:complete